MDVILLHSNPFVSPFSSDANTHLNSDITHLHIYPMSIEFYILHREYYNSHMYLALAFHGKRK